MLYHIDHIISYVIVCYVMSCPVILQSDAEVYDVNHTNSTLMIMNGMCPRPIV